MPQVNEIVTIPIPAQLERASYKTATWSLGDTTAVAGGTVTLQLSLDTPLQLGQFRVGVFKPSWLTINGIALSALLAPERQLTAAVASISALFTVSEPSRKLQQLVPSGVVISVYCTVGAGAPVGDTELVVHVPSTCGKVERAYGKQAANVLLWETENGTLTVTA